MTESAPPLSFSEQVQKTTPRAAIIELLEQHAGPKKPLTGNDSILVPNMMRINGIAVWASYDDPAVVHEIAVDGTCMSAFTVTVQVMARALRVGGTPAFEQTAEDIRVNAAVVLEIPDVDQWQDGEQLQRPWVLLNGHHIYTAGTITVGRMSVGGPGEYVAMVTIPLLCRQLIVDDLPASPYDNGGDLPDGPCTATNATGAAEAVAAG